MVTGGSSCLSPRGLRPEGGGRPPWFLATSNARSTKRGAAAWEDWAVENTPENSEIRRVAAALGLKPDVPIQEALARIEAKEDPGFHAPASRVGGQGLVAKSPPA